MPGVCGKQRGLTAVPSTYPEKKDAHVQVALGRSQQHLPSCAARRGYLERHAIVAALRGVDVNEMGGSCPRTSAVRRRDSFGVRTYDFNLLVTNISKSRFPQVNLKVRYRVPLAGSSRPPDRQRQKLDGSGTAIWIVKDFNPGQSVRIGFRLPFTHDVVNIYPDGQILLGSDFETDAWVPWRGYGSGGTFAVFFAP